MTELEMTQLCADAMGIRGHPVSDGQEMWSPDAFEHNKNGLVTHHGPWQIWNPLKDDGQAMALIKRFRIRIRYTENSYVLLHDGVEFHEAYIRYNDWRDLNRAVTECVAKMEQARRRRLDRQTAI